MEGKELEARMKSKENILSKLKANSTFLLKQLKESLLKRTGGKL